MVVKPEDILDLTGVALEMEQKIDNALLLGWPRQIPVKVDLPVYLPGEVMSELMQRYKAAGWTVHLRSRTAPDDRPEVSLEFSARFSGEEAAQKAWKPKG